MGYGPEGRGKNQGKVKILLFSTESRTALETTKPPIKWVTGTSFTKVKWPGCEADHSPPSSVEIKNYEAMPPFPNVLIAWHLIN
jgi:hypothetical protein